MDFRFEHTTALHLIWLACIFLPILFLFKYWQYQKNKAFIGKTLPFLIRKTSFSKKKSKYILEGLVLILLILAYARPQFGEGTQKIQRSGIEMIFAIDVSLSMLAEDIKPNRLDLAQKTLKRILNQSAGHKIGLVAFAGSAALVSPITSDYSALAMYIDSISTSLLSSQGTNFTQALTTARESFHRGGLQQEEGVHTSRAIIVISDGEDNEPGVLDKANELADEGLHIYTIAVGTKEGVPIPLRDQFGQIQGYKKDKSQKTVLSRLQDELLKQLALAGNGKFAYASFEGSEIKLLLNDLNQLEKKEFEEEKAINYKEQFQILLAIAILLLFIDLLLSEQIRPKPFRRS